MQSNKSAFVVLRDHRVKVAKQGIGLRSNNNTIINKTGISMVVGYKPYNRLIRPVTLLRRNQEEDSGIFYIYIFYLALYFFNILFLGL